MCQVHTRAYVSLLAPGKTDYTACHPGKTTTHMIPVHAIDLTLTKLTSLFHTSPLPAHPHRCCAAATAAAAARTPEMFELRQAPTRFDAATGTVVAGRDRVRLFAGALAALRELTTQERFSDTKIAVASSTTQRQWALDCLRLFEVGCG